MAGEKYVEDVSWMAGSRETFQKLVVVLNPCVDRRRQGFGGYRKRCGLRETGGRARGDNDG